MVSTKSFGRLLVIGALIAAPVVSMAQVVITASLAPPPLPVYEQPMAPGDGYLWTPGYWAWGPDGYYWVPGIWVRPPRIGYLWTPPYWGFVGGSYGFHGGYWGPHVGYYGGINYGYGYGGSGFVGGRWQGGVFAYNTAVSRVNVNVVHNTYVEHVPSVEASARPSFSGGPGGVQARPAADEARMAQEHHVGATPGQQSHFQAAQQNRAQYATANGGRPATLAMTRANEGNPRPNHAGHGGGEAPHNANHGPAQHENHQERPHGQEHEQHR